MESNVGETVMKWWQRIQSWYILCTENIIEGRFSHSIHENNLFPNLFVAEILRTIIIIIYHYKIKMLYHMPCCGKRIHCESICEVSVTLVNKWSIHCTRDTHTLSIHIKRSWTGVIRSLQELPNHVHTF